jgi:hypothetical protein
LLAAMPDGLKTVAKIICLARESVERVHRLPLLARQQAE